VFAVWLPTLAGDSRSAWDSNVLDDPRVVNLWDGDRIAGSWFADHGTGGLGSPGDVVWDAYFAFRPGSLWRAAPRGLVAAGSEIIGATDRLESSFTPLLTGG
jgi:hypothetical protein